MAVNSMDYSGKDTVIDVIRTERATFYNIIDDPKNWDVQTRCTDWEVRGYCWSYDRCDRRLSFSLGACSQGRSCRRARPASGSTRN